MKTCKSCEIEKADREFSGDDGICNACRLKTSEDLNRSVEIEKEELDFDLTD